MKVFKNHVAEWSVTTEKQYENPFRQVRMDADITGPEGKTVRIPGFWRGKGAWSFRFSAAVPGVYRWRTVCSDAENADLHGKCGEVTVEEAENEQNTVYQHGRVRVSADGHHFEYADGTPFFWLCDSWTMFMTKRLPFEGLREWIRDRSEKHFNTVMVNLGEFPDVMPFDDRAESEAGFPWDRDFTTVRPEYYDEADRRIQAILEGGLTPFIVGSWGHLIQFADEELVHLHMRNIVARYGAYPVMWCPAGEGTMMIHGDFRFTPEQNRPYREILLSFDNHKIHGDKARRIWTEVMREMRQTDAFHNLMTSYPSVFPYPYPVTSANQVLDESVLDFDMLHDYDIGGLFKKLAEDVQRQNPRPIVMCNPADGESSGMQKQLFWATATHGAAGVLYSNAGLLFVNDEKQVFGPSGHGCCWSRQTWREGLQEKGAKGIGQFRELLESYDWTHMKEHPEWVVGPRPEDFTEVNNMVGQKDNLPPITGYSLGEHVRLFHIPAYITREMMLSRKPRVRIGDKPIHAKAIDLNHMYTYDFGVACPDQKGEWIMHMRHCFYQPMFSDTLLILDDRIPITENDTIYTPKDAAEIPQEDDEMLRAVCCH